MKKLILGTLVFLGACGLSPDYHIGQSVIVTKGFYTGCTGTLEGQITPNIYDVALVCETKDATYTMVRRLTIWDFKEVGK